MWSVGPLSLECKLIMQVVNHVGAYGAAEFQPGPLYGPFDSPADYHPFKLITDWEDRLQSEQGQYPSDQYETQLTNRVAYGTYA
jgi:hypothetical protein